MRNDMRFYTFAAVVTVAGLAVIGCSPSGSKTTIQNKGSDTMLEVAQAWAELYDDASVEVSGGGSGVGISFLIAGKVDIANCSRAMKESELEKVRQKFGADPVEIVVGYDALAIYVHEDNPIEEISMEQLAGIFSKEARISKWSQLGLKLPGCESDIIELAGRQSSSGTYEYFREALVGKEGDLRLDINEQNGSRALVQFVASTPCAIGYSGMGYKTDAVKFVKVHKADAVAIFPSAAAVHDQSYVLARPLFMYTAPKPPAHVNAYTQWVKGARGQAVLEKIGYVRLSESTGD